MGEEEEIKKDQEEEKKSNEDEPVSATMKDEVQEIVLKVDMHCEACSRKVIRALHGFQGVEEVTADSKASKVVVKGKTTVDPLKICQRIQRKTRRKAQIISPLPAAIPPPQSQEHKTNPQLSTPPKEEQQQQEQPNKDQQPPAAAAVVTVVLSVRMHCEACAQALRKRIRKIQGVEAVTTDLVREQVIVKGVIDPAKLVDEVYNKTKKQVYIVKDEEKKEDEEEKKKKLEEGEKKKDGEEECKGSEEDDEKKKEIKKIEYVPSRYYTEYGFAYPSQMFSDENPNACSVM
ncbi:heavy metal-associated isoprenylated plant protein 7-like [Impatiens glandulifera]|uniref:heavy metal-associated isoprenylated plant protein 7-like n=1 Tax=Impatiens glandulifera TaxID=253017 RepID=UPI001FB11607|nr:heavy metal-associated isoprenylated plant protein 7-like [Impatiens glandulifera]